jgi:hypothetical protein
VQQRSEWCLRLRLTFSSAMTDPETASCFSWSSWAAMFAERGYTAVEVDIEAISGSSAPVKSIMDSMVSGEKRGLHGFQPQR